MIEPPPISRIERAANCAAKKLMLQVDRHRPVPVGLGDFGEATAGVVGGVVDQRADRPQALARLLHRRFERGEIGEVAFDEQRLLTARARPLNHLRRPLRVDVDEGDVGALGGEGLDHRRADSRSAAGNEDDAVMQAGIASVRHERQSPDRRGKT
jgi:hypothetical protein